MYSWKAQLHCNLNVYPPRTRQMLLPMFTLHIEKLAQIINKNRFTHTNPSSIHLPPSHFPSTSHRYYLGRCKENGPKVQFITSVSSFSSSLKQYWPFTVIHIVLHKNADTHILNILLVCLYCSRPSVVFGALEFCKTEMYFSLQTFWVDWNVPQPEAGTHKCSWVKYNGF